MPTGLGFLTVAQILQQGLLIGGNPGLAQIPQGYTQSPALTFIQAFIHHIYLYFDLPFMLTESAITTGTIPNLPYVIDLTPGGANAIVNYRNAKMLKLYQITDPLQFEQNYPKLKARILADYDNANGGTPPMGIPQIFSVNPQKTQIIVWPIPIQVYTGTLWAYLIPSAAAITTGTTLDYEDTNGLIQAVAMFARDYDKDTMVSLTEKIANQLFGEYRVNTEEANRATPNIPQLDSNRFRYRYGD